VFAGSTDQQVGTDRGAVGVSVEGTGPPVLLLHGYPQTRLTWDAVAARPTDRYTVVAADLPRYGDSFRPAAAPDHEPHSKGAPALDLIQAMAALGHERFDSPVATGSP
jgi:haloacetate dehalogenase